MGSRSPSGRWQRGALFLAFLVLSLFVFFVLGQFRPLVPRPIDLPVRIAAAAVCLAAALIARRSERYRRYGQLVFALFTGLVAISVDYWLLLGQRVASLAGISEATPAGLALDKLGSSLTVAVFVIALTLAWGDTTGSLYLRRGRLALGLSIGGAAFALAAATAVPLAGFMFGGKDLSLGRILPWTSWLLLFVLSNAFAEELLFRGLFLGRLEPFLGRFASNLGVAIPFVLMHYGVPYTARELLFPAAVLLLALAWGWLIRKTGSLWGSVLFHAGMDVSVMLGYFSNLPVTS